jgi:hypothetical protein
MKVLDKKVDHEIYEAKRTLEDIQANIESPFLASIHYIFETDNKIVLLTEAFEKGNLHDHISRI